MKTKQVKFMICLVSMIPLLHTARYGACKSVWLHAFNTQISMAPCILTYAITPNIKVGMAHKRSWPTAKLDCLVQ